MAAHLLPHYFDYRKASIIRRTLIGNKIVDYSDTQMWLEQRGQALLQLGLHFRLNELGKHNCKTRRETFRHGDLVRLILEVWR